MIDQIYEIEQRVPTTESFTPSSMGINSLSLKSDDIASFLKEDKVYTI
jgi:hypothetical protein